MRHRGYEGSVEYDADDNILHGRVLGIAGVVSYHGTSLAEVEEDFRAGVDSYLATCAAQGIDPDKPYNGKVLARMTPELHQRAAQCASAEGMSLNQFVVLLIEQATQKKQRDRSPPARVDRPRKKASAKAHR